MPLKRCAAEAATWLLQVSILLVMVAEAHAQGSAASDREVLEALYEGTGGPGWSDRANWLSEAPLGEWYGVVTDSNGRVTRLSIGGNGLSGTIPPALGRLASLERLDLGGRWDPEARQWVYNQLSGAIPPELASLSNLQRLYLWRNQLSGAIPPELRRLTNLESLDLGFNQDLSGTIPTWLQQLPLSSLSLMATALCEPLDAEFQQWLATIDFLPSGASCGRLTEAMSSIDVAVFYTPAARRMAGGATEIETFIDLMVAETNQAYEDSGVNQRIVLAASEEVQYEDTSGFSALSRLADRADGYMDEVHEIRDRVGADLVHLIIEVTDLGGVADLPGAFSLSAAGTGAVTFAHELGA